MPEQALGDSEYFAGGFASKIDDNEHTTPSLGHSEVLAVHDSPRDVHRPALCQRRENDSKIFSGVGGEEPWDILENSDSWTDTRIS